MNNGHDLVQQNEELMCIGGPLHGSIRPRTQYLQFTCRMPANPSAPNPKYIDEEHTYVLSTFDYSPDCQVKFWRHKPLDLGRCAQFVMLDFLVNRPSLRLAAAFSLIRAIERRASETQMIASREILKSVASVFPPQRPPQTKDPQP